MSSKVQNKIDNGREYRNFVIPFEIRAAENDEMIVEGYATTFNQPYTLADWGDYVINEQVDARAFDNCDMTDVIFQYDHEGRVFARNKNGTLSLSVDERGLKVRADLGGTDIGRQLYQEIKGGYTDKMSFGFIVAEDRREEVTENDRTVVLRTILSISKLYDVSAVSIPANDATVISARNFSDGLIEEIKAERLKEQQAAEQRKHIENEIELKIKLMEV